MLISGFSSESNLPEEYQITFKDGESEGPQLFRNGEMVGEAFFGMGDVIHRLLFGYSSKLRDKLIHDPNCKNDLEEIFTPFVIDSMPIKDAITVAHFLVDTTIKAVNLTEAVASVGGHINIATITKREGFRWITRNNL